jgi:hypothetical protein
MRFFNYTVQYLYNHACSKTKLSCASVDCEVPRGARFGSSGPGHKHYRYPLPGTTVQYVRYRVQYSTERVQYKVKYDIQYDAVARGAAKVRTARECCMLHVLAVRVEIFLNLVVQMGIRDDDDGRL